MPLIEYVPDITSEQIKEKVEELNKEIFKLQAQILELEMQKEPYKMAVKYWQKQCKHVGQKTGYNERDGSWGNPCPTCSYSY